MCDTLGTIYVADASNYRIATLQTNDGISHTITALIGNGATGASSVSTSLLSPIGKPYDLFLTTSGSSHFSEYFSTVVEFGLLPLTLLFLRW